MQWGRRGSSGDRADTKHSTHKLFRPKKEVSVVFAGSAVSLHHLPYALIRIGMGTNAYMSEALFERIVSRRCRGLADD